MDVFKVGQAINVIAEFEVDGVDTDPNSVVFTLVDPNGTVSSTTPTRDSVGHYHFTVDLTNALPGVWAFKWQSTSPAQGTREGSFLVEATAI